MFGSFVPHQWLVWNDICFGSFSVCIYCGPIWQEVVLDPLQSVFFCRIWREIVLDPFQAAYIVAASGGKLVFCSWPHLAGSLFSVPFESASLFLVPFQSASIVAAFGGKLFL